MPKTKPKKWDPAAFAPHQHGDIKTRNVNIDKGFTLCKRCDGTGNELFSCFKRCSDCGGSGQDRAADPPKPKKPKRTAAQLRKANCESVKRYQHKMRDTYPEWETWCSMKRRCHISSHRWYENYGGKGISVCDRWRKPGVGFFNFLRDMGPRPSALHDCDRKDSSKNYEPGNCRWLHQSKNRSVRTPGDQEKKPQDGNVPF
jgi:hypothetical protein